jgi:hypothetical protein
LEETYDLEDIVDDYRKKPIEEDKRLSWKWRIGIALGVFGLVPATGSIPKTDEIIEKALFVLISFGGYFLVGVLIGWLLDLWVSRGGRKMR